MKERINVTQAFLPPQDEFNEYISQIWKSKWLTNQGPLLREFEKKVSVYLGVDSKRFHFVTNGTLALQLAIHVSELDNTEVITTPFSYVATTSAILWQKAIPVFVDIDPLTLCIDPHKIEEKITKNTRAIVATHVFGMPCDIEAIEKIAEKHNLKVIYDAAHSFGVTYKGKSIFRYGDLAIGSFHATKLFHTIEGGCVVVNDQNQQDKVEFAKRFGHHDNDHYILGINAKASEFQAAMGLCNLKYVDEIINQRSILSESYDQILSDKFQVLRIDLSIASPNYAYYPIIFSSEQQLQAALSRLQKENIFPRRYFYPSLNQLPYISTASRCPISEDIARRIACLPLYPGLTLKQIEEISSLVCGI